MHHFDQIEQLQSFLQESKKQGKTIGFVPTMGALHHGHLSLIEAAQSFTDVTVCSIFVNPTQFNEKADFSQYARTPEKDTALLEAAGCQVVFMPSVTEIYPKEGFDMPRLNLGFLDKPMEGKHRPGHFAGMVQVVYRLLSIVQPDQLFMGQKDFQQQKIVAALLEQAHLPVQLITCPIIREADGLAMSSRNVQLPHNDRLNADKIYQVLQTCKAQYGRGSVKQMIKMALNQLNNTPNMQAEYFEIVNAETLLPVQHWFDANRLIACAAVRLGNVRLIDNMYLS